MISRRNSRLQRVIQPAILVALVALVILSEVPSEVWSPAIVPPPAVAKAPLMPTAHPATAPPRAPASSAPNVPSLCLLGVDPDCRPGANGTLAASAVPDVDPPSSWTNITPPNGTPNPTVRFLPSMAYDPAAHGVVLFGGYGEVGLGPWVFYQDTWLFSSGHWTALIPSSSCTPSTCPHGRAGAMLAYDPADHGLLLFGGYVYSPSITFVPFNDTWLLADGSWTNLTAAGLGASPSPRFEAAMVSDTYDNDVMLFGGSLATGTTLGDTWTFDGRWTNLTASESLHPVARAGAAIAGSPSGWILLFGGEDNGTIILDPNCGSSTVAWWFYHNAWHYLGEPACIDVIHSSAALPNGTFPPCGRIDAALGFSPKNERFVLYGGFGPSIQTSATCSGFYNFLNDTWTYANPPGSGFVWYNATDAGDPSAREQIAYASDYSDGYFEVFGGWDGRDGGLNETWRFFEQVHARLSGPSDIETNGSLSFNVPFEVTGFGGTGNLSYTFAIKGVRNTNTLVGTGCANLTDGASSALPYDGLSKVTCTPLPTSYNRYRLSVTVVDNENLSDFAKASWTFTVSPPESMAIYSQFKGYFYSNISFPNKFGVLASVAGLPALSLSATLTGAPLTFSQRGSDPLWWDATVDMGGLPPGPLVLRATAQFGGNWTLNATYSVTVVETPSWLQSVIEYPQVTQTISKKGTGPYNETFSISEAFSWSLDKALGFNIKLPFVSGNVSLIPAIKISLTATSAGNLTLTGTLSLTPPSINLGIAKLSLSATFSLKGTFSLGIVQGQITGVKWQSAVASVTVQGKFGVSVPIYGFDILGVKVGFTLEVNVNPSVTIGMLLAPTTPGFDEFISGIAVKIQQFVGGITLPLSVAVSFGIGIASIAIGGQISVALSLATNTGLYITAGWVNGSIFVSATALWWSDQWNLASGVIYSWTNPPPAMPAAPGGGRPAYDNGSGSTWVPHSRYYNLSGYDAPVWNSANASGPAISDIYPSTDVSAAAGPNGTYLYYTDDATNRPVDQGLGISGLFLNSSSNGLGSVPAPSDPGFLVFHPRATTLPDGNVYVLWNALPIAEESVASPTDLTSIALHGAEYSTARGTWGPVHRWTSGGFAQSFAIDPTGSSPSVAVLTSSALLTGASAPEHLLDFDLASGTLRDNSSVSGLSEIESIRGGLGDAIVKEMDGNYTTVSLTRGSATPFSYAPPRGGLVTSAGFVAGSSDTVVLLYQGTSGTTLVLYDLATDQPVSSTNLGPDASQAEAITNGSTVYAFVETTGGVVGWSETGGVFTNLTNISEPGITSYALAQDGGGILVYSLTAAGNSSQPIVTLRFVEVGASLAPVGGASSPGTTGQGKGASTTTYAEYLGAGAAAVALILAGVAITTRRAPKSPVSATPSPDAPSSPDSPPPTPPSGGGPTG
ncbi:MAG TPA: hypothetical protein VML94_07930 [Thermoplasmata archaeon]|nr:hypothetical protein [Thermoplasmata archaeon]